MFRVDYAIEAAGGREFGTVFIHGKENVALASVTAGWARVRASGGQQSPYHQDLIKAAEGAEASGAGMHTADKEAVAAAVRDAQHSGEAGWSR